MTWNISHNISVDNEGNHQSAYGHGADYVSETKDIYNYKTINCNKNMNRNRKNIVRLTESKLRNMIKESVNQILTELDWKTYANAAKKAGERSNKYYWRDKEGLSFPDDIKKAMRYSRMVSDFRDAAKSAFNRDYSYKHGDPQDDDYAEVAMYGDFHSTEEFAPHIKGHNHKSKNDKYYYGPYNPNSKETTIGGRGKKMGADEFFNGNKEASAALDRANNDFNNYKQGKSKYIKGKGWQ